MLIAVVLFVLVVASFVAVAVALFVVVAAAAIVHENACYVWFG